MRLSPFALRLPAFMETLRKDPTRLPGVATITSNGAVTHKKLFPEFRGGKR